MPEPASKAGKSRGKDIATEGERVPAAQAEGTERTRDRPVYAPRVDIIETEEALEIFADMAGVTKDSVEVTLEHRVLTLRGRGEISLPEDLAPLYMEYQPGDYESFTLSVDPAGIEARVRGGVLRLRLPETGPAKRQRIRGPRRLSKPQVRYVEASAPPHSPAGFGSIFC
jgi:HSP20 family protein